MLACVSFNQLLLPTQVHHGSQSGAMPSGSASREASVLELADIDREVRSKEQLRLYHPCQTCDIT